MNLPKIATIGIYDSAIARPGVRVSQNRKVSVFEIELPLEKGGVTYVDSASEPIDTDMTICAKPGQVRHTEFPFRCFYVHMLVQPGTICDILSEIPTFMKTEKYEVYREFFSKMFDRYNSFSDKEELMIQSVLLELIYTLSSDAALKVHTSGTGGFDIEKTLNYIDSHITEDLSLGNLAELNSLSEIHFHNVFRSAMGKTLRKYVEEIRIKKAVNLMLTTNYNLTAIAYECGFSSQSYFSYAFRRRMGCTPREYVRGLYERYERGKF